MQPKLIGLRIDFTDRPQVYQLCLYAAPDGNRPQRVAVLHEGRRSACIAARKRLLADVGRVPVLIGAAGQFGRALAAWLAEQSESVC